LPNHHTSFPNITNRAGKTVISIALILKGMKEARENAALPNKSSATLVVVPGHLILQWQGEFEKFAPHLKVLCIYDADSLLNVRVQDLIHADCVICPVDILETKGYLQHLLEISGRDTEDCPIIPSVSYFSGGLDVLMFSIIHSHAFIVYRTKRTVRGIWSLDPGDERGSLRRGQ
jgi:hypothetical protein